MQTSGPMCLEHQVGPSLSARASESGGGEENSQLASMMSRRIPSSWAKIQTIGTVVKHTDSTALYGDVYCKTKHLTLGVATQQHTRIGCQRGSLLFGLCYDYPPTEFPRLPWGLRRYRK